MVSIVHLVIQCRQDNIIDISTHVVSLNEPSQNDDDANGGNDNDNDDNEDDNDDDNGNDDDNDDGNDDDNDDGNDDDNDDGNDEDNADDNDEDNDDDNDDGNDDDNDDLYSMYEHVWMVSLFNGKQTIGVNQSFIYLVYMERSRYTTGINKLEC